jgi:transposase-like protein
MAFKRKVVMEIESGKINIERARELYGIGGACTIQKWMKNFGKSKIISHVVRIQMKNEMDEIKKIKKEKQKLESALAQSQVENYALKALIEIAKENYGIDLKKKHGEKESPMQRRKRKRNRLK